MAEIKKEEAMFHDAIKGFLGKREQGLVMGHFRAVLSANAGRVDAGLYLDEQSKVFYALMDDLRFANDIRKVEDAEIIWDAAIAFYKSHAAPTQQVIDAGRQG